MVAASSKRLSDIWWLVLLQGIAMLVLGILLLTATGVTLVTIILFVGAYWLVDGIFSIVRIFLKDSDIHWGWLLARGILGILAGILVLRHPLWATVLVPATLVIILGIQGIIMGAISLVQAFKGDGWWAGILGALSVIFGLILLFNPLLGAAVLPVVLGILGIVGGIVLIVLSFRIRSAS
jgi:uncharacterized membrane protein HdeD (DUF308 family)